MANPLTADFFEKNIAHVALLSPCTKITGLTRPDLKRANDIHSLFLFAMKYFDWWHLGGEGFFEQEDVLYACSVFPEICAFADALTEGVPAAYSIKEIAHFGQTAIVDRFQEFNEEYRYWFEKSSRDEQKRPHIPIEDIMIPTSMYVAADDDLCVLDNSRWTRDQMMDDTIIRY